MIEVTDADRAAAEAFWQEHGPWRMGSMSVLATAFTRHRLAERDAVVKWLRKTANMNPQAPGEKAFVLLLCDAIEAGGYLK